LNPLFDDHFDTSSLDLNKWEVIQGSAPPLSDSRVQVENCCIETKQAYQALPLWIQVLGVHYLAMPSNDSAIIIAIYRDGGGCSADVDLHRSGSTYFEGSGWSYGSLQGWGPLDYYDSLPGDTFDIVFLLMEDKLRIFVRDRLRRGVSYITAMTGAFKCYLWATDGASFTVDRVRICDEIQTNPVYKLMAPGANNNIAFGETGVTLSLNNLGSEYGYVKVEKIYGTPPGLSSLSLPYYWRIVGMDGLSFNANLNFGYFPVDVAALGRSETELKCFHSDDYGTIWNVITGTVDTINHCYTVTDVNQVSLWALGFSSVTASKNWFLYE